MSVVTRTITLRSAEHYGRRVPPRDLGRVLQTAPELVRRSIRMAFEGRSTARGSRPRWLKAASDVRFVDHGGDDDTILYFEAPILGEAAEELYAQQELWPNRPDPQDTGFDLLGDVVRDVEARQRDSDRYDRPLLTELQRLGRGLDHTFQECVITGGRYIAEEPAVVNRHVIESAEALTQATPRSRQVRVGGVLDMLRASTNTLAIQLSDGSEVRAVLVHGDVASHHDLLKKSVVLLGKAVYRPSGNLLRIDAVEVRPMEAADTFFDRVPEARPESVTARAIGRQERRRGGVAAIIGRWPGDESDEEVNAALQELS
jgi:hypothetical protein